MTAIDLILAAIVVFQTYALITTRRRLFALRRNCFVTNDKGHRVRYINAPDVVQARVEK